MTTMLHFNPHKGPDLHYSKLKGYKYIVRKEITFLVPWLGEEGASIWDNEEEVLVHLYSGLLTVYPGYCWDGPSGMTIDTKAFIKASLSHDVLYQMLRRKKIPLSCRKWADEYLRRFCIEYGMSKFRAGYVHKCVRLFGKKYAVNGVEPINVEYVI